LWKLLIIHIKLLSHPVRRYGINDLSDKLKIMNALDEKEIETLSTTQVNLLKAVASKETQFTSTSTMNDYRLGIPRNVSKNKNTLMIGFLKEGLQRLSWFQVPWQRERYPA